MSKSGERDARNIPVAEERVSVARRERVTGIVRLRKRVRAEEAVVDEPLHDVEVEVQRLKVDRWLDAPAAVRREGETTIYPVIEEVLVLEKRLKLVEEVRVTRRRAARRATDRVAVRREEVTVERLGAPDDLDVPDDTDRQ